MNQPIARWPAFVLDCPDPERLGRFYAELTAMEVVYADPDWVQVGRPPGPVLSFQRVENHQPPDWPDGSPTQQAHLDFAVADMDEAERAAVALGAARHDHQPSDDFRVMVDPAGHLFCLVKSDI